MTEHELQIQKLYESLKAAAYYIERLEMFQSGKRVRDFAEAKEHYYRVAVPLIVAYESEGT